MEIKAKIQLLVLKRRVFHTFSFSMSNIYNGRSFRPKHTAPLPYSAAPITAIITQLPVAPSWPDTIFSPGNSVNGVSYRKISKSPPVLPSI